MYFFMFNDGGDVICSGVSTLSNLVEGAIEVTKEMYEAKDKTIYYKIGAEILTRDPRPSENHTWVVVDNVGSWAIDLALFRQAKSLEILQACQIAIVSGFVSYALGDEYHYPSKTSDQQNLAASVLASYDPENEPTWSTPFWCADGSGQWEFRPHTASQIREVGRDAKASILGFQFNNEQLQAQISAASTAEEIEAITWSN